MRKSNCPLQGTNNCEEITVCQIRDCPFWKVRNKRLAGEFFKDFFGTDLAGLTKEEIDAIQRTRT